MTTPAPTTAPTLPPGPPCREYDQVLSGDVNIKKKSNGEYKITFSKKEISDILIYQTWSDKWPQLNADRQVLKLKAKKWVKMNFVNAVPNAPVPYKPTCVMELDDG